MTLPTPQPGILDISAYVPGESGAGGAARPIKLSSNEAALGASLKAIAAFRDASASLHRYPDGSATALRQAIADRYGLDATRIICGAGSDELLTLLATAYLGPDTQALMTQHAFLIFQIATRASGATPVLAPERNLATDVDALLARVTERTRMIFLANPNNPTGTYIPFEEIRRLHRGLPEHVVLVLDAAYAEFVQGNDYEAALRWATSADNVVVTSTFSKVYGLAGLRLGWAYCPPAIADVLNRIRTAFNVSGPAQAAGIAALSDQAHVAAAVAHNKRWRQWLGEQLGALGLKTTASVCNFHLVVFPMDPERDAAAAYTFLKARHIYLRPVGAYGLGYALRLTVGTEDENKAVIAALTDFMAKDRSQ